MGHYDFMESLLPHREVETIGQGMKESEATHLFGASFSSIKRYASVAPFIVNLGQGRQMCRDDEGCAPLPDRSLLQRKNLPTVHPDLGIGETA